MNGCENEQEGSQTEWTFARSEKNRQKKELRMVEEK